MTRVHRVPPACVTLIASAGASSATATFAGSTAGFSWPDSCHMPPLARKITGTLVSRLRGVADTHLFLLVASCGRDSCSAKAAREWLRAVRGTVFELSSTDRYDLAGSITGSALAGWPWGGSGPGQVGAFHADEGDRDDQGDEHDAG